METQHYIEWAAWYGVFEPSRLKENLMSRENALLKDGGAVSDMGMGYKLVFWSNSQQVLKPPSSGTTGPGKLTNELYGFRTAGRWNIIKSLLLIIAIAYLNDDTSKWHWGRKSR